MTIQEILAGGGGLLLILMTLVQIAPVKINPWSALAKAIGKAINADISKRLDEIEKKLDSHIKTDDQGRADVICTPFTGHPVEGVLLCGTHMSTKGNV